VQEGAETRKQQGPIAVLALLLGLLLAHAPAAAQIETGRIGSGLAEAELVKAPKSLRTASRSQAEAADADEYLAGAPSAPRRLTVTLYASVTGAAPEAAPAAGRPPLRYRARAPPAA
jgi:hypothetical protein